MRKQIREKRILQLRINAIKALSELAAEHGDIEECFTVLAQIIRTEGEAVAEWLDSSDPGEASDAQQEFENLAEAVEALRTKAKGLSA